MNEDYTKFTFTNPQKQAATENMAAPASGAGQPQDNLSSVGAYAGNHDEKKKKKRKIWIIVAIIAAVLILLGIISYFIADAVNGADYGESGPYIGNLYIEGEITSDAEGNDTYQQDWLLEQIDYMQEDDLNKGILLYVNSPGGGVYATDEVYLRLLDYKKETKRPLYAYFAETAASGGYYLAMAADRITANRNCTTGSIGVYAGPIIDASGLLSKLGVKVDIVRSGANKAMGNSFESMTEEQRNIYQNYVYECYDQFVSIVAKGRNMDESVVRPLADGRIYTASQAKANGLIDEIGTLEEAQYDMLKKEKLEDCEFEDVQYMPSYDLYSYFMKATERTEASTDLQIAMQLLEEGSSPEVKYLMS